MTAKSLHSSSTPQRTTPAINPLPPRTKVGITGGIGCGKSYVCRKLSEKGIIVYDCDSAAKRIMNSSEAVRKAIIELIGTDAYADGQLDKTKVRAFLLASDANKQAINSIVHPAVAEDFKTSGISWMESAILFESGFDRLVDHIVAITASEETRIARIMRRDGISESKARAWISQQWPQEKVAERADYIIVNDNDTDLDKQINDFINKLNNNV